MGSEREKYPWKNETNEKSEQVMHAAKWINKCQSEPVLFSDICEILTIDKHISKLKEDIFEIIEETYKVNRPAASIIETNDNKGKIIDLPIASSDVFWDENNYSDIVSSKTFIIFYISTVNYRSRYSNTEVYINIQVQYF